MLIALIALIACLLGVCALLVFVLVRAPGSGIRLPRRPTPDQLEIVTDLDAILSSAKGFVFQGKTFVVPPLEVERLFIAYQALSQIRALGMREEEIRQDELVDAYTAFFAAVCPELDRKQVQAMSLQQIGQLYSLMLKHVTGEKVGAAEKKSPLKAEEQATPPRS